MANKWLKTIILLVFFAAVIATSCKKDHSYEGGYVNLPATGSLLDSLGNCNGAVVSGHYIKDSALTAADHADVFANITVAGRYSIYTDTVGGVSFLDTGIVLSAGKQSFRLKAYGRPTSSGPFSFTVHFGKSICSFMIPVDSAVYIFNGQDGGCPIIPVSGIYHAYESLNPSDTVNVPLTVTRPGTYSLRTPVVNGISFSATGVFPATGNYLLKLSGNGTPGTNGTFNFTLQINGYNCSFPVNVSYDSSQYLRFSADGKTYFGYLPGVKLASATDTGYFNPQYPGIRFFGSDIYSSDTSLPNSSLGLIFQRVFAPISVGTYHPYMVGKDYNIEFYLLSSSSPSSNGGFLFRTNAALPTFSTVLSVYDTASGLIQGTFNGPVYNIAGQVSNIINGEFKTHFVR